MQTAMMEDLIRGIETVTYQMAELKELKDKMEQKLLDALGRVSYNDAGDVINISKEGQDTNYVGKYAVVVKTDYLYGIDKDELEIFGNKIPSAYNPIVEKSSFEVNKKLLKEAHKYASADEMAILSKIIIQKFAKPSLKISLNV